MRRSRPQSNASPWQRLRRYLFGEQVWSGGAASPRHTAGARNAITDASFDHPGGGDAAVLLIHGLTGTPTEMRYVGKKLAQAGFAVHGVQLAGHCGTEEDLLHTRWPDWYASVEQAFERLGRQHKHVFVAGLSMGAILALHLASSHPGRVQGLALFSPTLWYDGWSIPKLIVLLPLIHTPLGARYRFVENFPFGIKDDRLRQRVVTNML